MGDNIFKICRVCGSHKDTLIPIFEGEGIENEIEDKIDKYLPVKFKREDKKTKRLKVCLHCTNIIVAFDELYVNSIDNHEKFVRIAKKLKENEEDDDDEPMSYEAKTDEDEIEYEEEHEKKEEKKFSCHFCCGNSSFADREEYVEHLKDQHTSQIFHCEQCDDYLDQQILMEHMQEHFLNMMKENQEPEGEIETPKVAKNTSSSSDAKSLLKCLICDKVFANRSSFSYHMNQVHSKIKKFECNFCQRQFGTKRILKNHISCIHVRERCHKCLDCDKMFKTDVALYNHIKSHKTNLEFKCKFCHKEFKYRHHLTNHENIHEDDRRFVCNFCKKTFNARDNLYKHKKIHEDAEIKCRVCNFKTTQKRYLVEHEKRMHLAA